LWRKRTAEKGMINTRSTILIVDDDEPARNILAALLDSPDYDIACASNGAEALLLASQIQPDIILLDVLMPGMNGFQVCRRLRANPLLAEVPVLLVTGLADQKSLLEGLNAGADDFISKPFDRIVLRTRVATIIRLNRYRQLQEERAKFEQLVNLSPDGILLLDDERVIRLTNPAMGFMLHEQDTSALLNRNVITLIAEAFRPQFEDCLQWICGETDQVCHFELLFTRVDATQFPVEISASHVSLQGQSAVQLIVRDITERKKAEAQLRRAHEELTRACDMSLEGWSRALELRDRETEGHAQRVAEMTLVLARAMGIRDDQLVHIRRGALLHDIGKMGIPDAILHNPGALTEDEWVIMRKHPEYACEMLSPIAYLRPALDIPRYHHEWWDGTGYPYGLKGEAIPLAARMFAVVDVWDALSSNRPYSDGWAAEAVYEHILSLAGTQLDPAVVEAFLRLCPGAESTDHPGTLRFAG
jgi:PAS domain S-box-containing protein